MAKIERRWSLAPSVLDRLLDDVPWESQDPPSNFNQDLERLKASVRRDLELLLNTRQEALTDISGFAQAERSLLTYGLPDFTSLSLQREDDRTQVRTMIERAIEIFEPRLQHVVVTVETLEENRHQLAFRVDAQLRTDPVPAPVTFDAVLQLSTQQYQVRG